MGKWYKPALAVAGSALMAVPLLAFALPEENAQDDKEKAQARKELKELEDQRAKLDSRIQEMRKKAGVSGGHSYIFSDGKLLEIPGVSGEHSVIVQRAMENANKAVAEAMKNMPKHFEKFDFNFDTDKDGKSRQIIINKDGKTFKWDDKMSEEDKKKFKEQMEKMKIQIHENLKGLKDMKIHVPEFRSFSGGTVVVPRVATPRAAPRIAVPRATTPEFRVIEPRLRGDDDSRVLRDEIRSLRDEVQRLRDEVRRGRSGGRSSENIDRIDNLPI